MNYKDKSKEELIKEITELQTTYHQLESKYTENSFQIERNQSIQEFQSGIADALVTSPNLIHFLHIVREELSKIMDTNNFFVAFYNEETGMLRADLDLDTMDNISEWSAENSLTGYLLKLNKSKLLTKSEILELIKNKKASMQGTLPECWLGVPLYNDKKVMGAIVVQSYDNPDEYNLEHESILRLIANQLSVFILHKENENKLKESEKSFRGLFHTIGDSIYVMNYDSQFIDINTGQMKWRVGHKDYSEGYPSGPIIADGVVIFGNGPLIVAIE